MAVRKTIVGILFGKVAQAASRILLVPIIISAVGASTYGEWLLYSSITTWLMMSNLGVGTYVANQMSLKFFSEDIDGARQIYTVGLLINSVILVGTIVLASVVALILWWIEKIQFEHAIVILLVAISVPVSFYAEIFGGKQRLVNKNHIGGILSGVRAWIEPVLTILFLSWSKSLMALAIAVILTSIFHVVLTYIIAARTEKKCTLDLKATKKLNISDFISVVAAGFGFLAFPLGNAIVFQGSLLAIGATLGPLAVATYGTARMAARVLNQLLEVLNQAIWPQLSMLFAQKKFEQLLQLWRRATISSASIAAVTAVAFAYFGPDVYAFWIKGAIQPDKSLFLWLSLAIPFGVVWSSAGVLLLSLNAHRLYGAIYAIVSIIFLLLCYMLSNEMGLNGVAVAGCILDIVMVIATAVMIYKFKKKAVWQNAKLELESK